MIKFIKPYLPLLGISLLFCVVSIASLLYIPILIGDSIDLMKGFNDVDFESLYVIIFKLIIVVITYFIFFYSSNITQSIISFKIIKKIRLISFDNLLNLPIRYYDTTSHGDILSRFTNDCEVVSTGLVQGFNQLFTGIFLIIGTVVFMFLLNVTLTFVVLLITPLSLIIAYLIAKGTYEKYRETGIVFGKMSGHIEEMFTNQKTVKAFSYEDASIEKFEVLNTNLKNVSFKSQVYTTIINPSTRFINSLMYAVCGVVGGIIIIKQIDPLFSIGGLSSFLFYATQYTKPFNEVSGVISEFQSAITSFKRINEIMNEEKETNDETIIKTDSFGIVEFRNVYFSYTENPFIEDLNLKVSKKSKVAIVGSTGCGKTTLINLLLRFYDVNQGGIFIDNVNTKDINKSSLRNLFGLVLQETWVFSGTILDNIKYSKKDATLDDVIEASKKANIYKQIMRTKNGFDTIITPTTFSIGEQQLLNIARIMLNNPPMLVLDEATSSIDTLTEVKIQKAIEKIMENKTSFIIAHRLQTIITADIIVVMSNGKIIETGKHLELLEKKGYYYTLYNSQYKK